MNEDELRAEVNRLQREAAVNAEENLRRRERAAGIESPAVEMKSEKPKLVEFSDKELREGRFDIKLLREGKAAVTKDVSNYWNGYEVVQLGEEVK